MSEIRRKRGFSEINNFYARVYPEYKTIVQKVE